MLRGTLVLGSQPYLFKHFKLNKANKFHASIIKCTIGVVYYPNRSHYIVQFAAIDYTEDEKKVCKDLSEEEKEKVQQVLYITDSFCIGEVAYHKFTMTNGREKLHRSYLVKQCKNYFEQPTPHHQNCKCCRRSTNELESELNTIKQQASLLANLVLHTQKEPLLSPH